MGMKLHDSYNEAYYAWIGESTWTITEPTDDEVWAAIAARMTTEALEADTDPGNRGWEAARNRELANRERWWT